MADSPKNKVSEDTYTFDSSLVTSAMEKKKEKQQAELEKLSRRKKKLAATTAAAVILAIAAVYFGGWAASMGKFLPNTYINNIDVSGMSVSEAVAAVGTANAPDRLTVTERGGNEKTFSLTEFDYTYDIFSEIRQMASGISHAGWIASYFRDSSYTINATPRYNEEKLKRLIRNTSWGSVETADAKLVHGADGYYIQDEVYGDRLSAEKVSDYVAQRVADGEYNITLTSSGLYTDPEVKADDLTSRLTELNSKFNYVLTYDFTYTQETLSGADVYEWMTDNGTIDRSKAEAYVAKLADRYDTFMSTRRFNTTKRGTITMEQGRYSTGQYGWWIDRKKTVNKLLSYIEAGESVTVEPVYVKLDTGYTYRGFDSARSADGDIGNTYIEVDLTNQHLWYYENGKVKFETDQIVSGLASDPKRKTPPGVYSVYSKNTNYTMKAADGSYTAKCSYFMRISFEGIGFHDLSRSVYGGNTYLTNGSHGCVNMKYDEVKTLFEIVEWGTPVILYY